MLDLALAALLALAPAPQDPRPPAPTPEEVERACDALQEAFAKGESGERLRAIEAAAELADKRVVGLVALGLKDEEREVRDAALAALRHQRHPQALEELHAAYKRNKLFDKKHDKERAELTLAIGQHASPSSLKLLADGALDTVNKHTTHARILSLGRVREPAAVSELISLMNKAGRGGGGRGGGSGQFQADLRLALWALTGTDEGTGIDGWQRWWNDNKRGLELPEEPPDEPRMLAARWRVTWAAPGEKGAGKRGGAGEGRKRKKRDGSGELD